MIPLIRALYDHQAWADAALLGAVRNHAGAAADAEIRRELAFVAKLEKPI